MVLSEELYHLILHFLAGEASEEEKSFLQGWRTESEEHEMAYREIARLWYDIKWKKKASLISGEDAWKQWIQKRNRYYRKKMMYRIVSIAASVAIILGSVWLYRSSRLPVSDTSSIQIVASPMESKATLTLSNGEKILLTEKMKKVVQEQGGVSIQTDSARLEYRQKNHEDESKEIVYNELTIPKCGEYTLKLADGTQVFMNSASSLRFPVTFNEDTREVYLQGEAYFQVAKNTKQPFIVHTERTAVRVLGTEFNVMAYSDEENTQVTLIEGSVDVSAQNNEHDILKPGEQFSIHNTTLEASVRQVNIEQYIAWKKGLFCFDAMPLEQLMRGLGRWYDISYLFREESLRKLRFTGGFKRTEKIENIFRMIEDVTDVRFHITGNTIVVDRI